LSGLGQAPTPPPVLACIWPRTKDDVNDLFERLEALEKEAEKAKVQREDSKLHSILKLT